MSFKRFLKLKIRYHNFVLFLPLITSAWSADSALNTSDGEKIWLGGRKSKRRKNF